jgi:hypothetical protein
MNDVLYQLYIIMVIWLLCSLCSVLEACFKHSSELIIPFTWAGRFEAFDTGSPL